MSTGNLDLPGRLRWVAGRDRVAHARRGNAPRTACGVPAIAIPFAWPETSRCPTCVRMAAALQADLEARP